MSRIPTDIHNMLIGRAVVVASGEHKGTCGHVSCVTTATETDSGRLVEVETTSGDLIRLCKSHVVELKLPIPPRVAEAMIDVENAAPKTVAAA